MAVGKPSSRPRWSPTTTVPRTSWSAGAGREARRVRDLALGEQLADPGRRVGHPAGVALDRDEPEAEHLEAELGAHLLEQAHVAVAPVPEVEVGADDDEPGAEPADQHLAARSPRPARGCAPRRT